MAQAEATLEPIGDGQDGQDGEQGSARAGSWLTWLALAGWVALVVGAWLIGSHLNRVQANDMLVQAPPLTGHFDLRLRLWIGPAIAVAIAGVWFAPTLSRRLSWRSLLLVAAVAAGVWAFFLAMGDGPNHLTWPVRSHNDYYADLGLVASDPVGFVSRFVETLPTTAAHTRGHPPGFLLVLWAMEQLGMGGVSRVAALEIIGGAMAVPAILVSLRDVAGEARARQAAPFLVLAPTALWVATTADAFFAGLTAWAITLIIVATGRRDRRADLLAVAGGLLFGFAVFSSYGMVLAGAIPLVVAIARRRVRPLLLAAGGVLVVTVAFLMAGFWWLDGLRATKVEYDRGISRFRPYGYFVFANLAAFAITIGPAMAPALARLRDRRVWWLVSGALLAVLVADLSGMSRAEVERIWLPFAIWVLPAGIALARSPRLKWWLGLQASFAIVLQVTFRGPG